MCYIGYKSDRTRQRLESIVHRAIEQSDHQYIISSFNYSESESQRPDTLQKISYDNLPISNYHVWTSDSFAGVTIANRLAIALTKKDCKVVDLRGKTQAEIFGVSTLVSTIANNIYYILDSYMPKFIEKAENNPNVHFIVASRSENPIANKLIDNGLLQMYRPSSLDPVAFMSLEKQLLVAISDIS